MTVIRDGRLVLTRELAGVTPDDLIRAMVGRELPERVPQEQSDRRGCALQVERLTREGVFVDISFEVRAGEIVALAGPRGRRTQRGRTGCLRDRPLRRRARVPVDKPLRRRSPTPRMRAGVGLVPEDRRQQGLVMSMAIGRNIAMASLGGCVGRLHPFGERAPLARDWATRLQVKYGRLGNPIDPLSGGNQQKVVLAKWLGGQPEAADRRRADARDRHRHEGRGASPARGARRSGRRRADDLVASCPRCCGSRTGSSSCARGALVAEFAHADATEEAIVAAATGQLEEVAA